jgi:hypothetical protein
MLRIALGAVCATVLAGCATPAPDDEAQSQLAKERPTGSNIKRREPSVLEPRSTVTREELEKGGIPIKVKPPGGS